MNRSENINDLVAALAQAQAGLSAVTKNREVTVKPKDDNKRPYTFWYATLDAIVEHVRLPLTSQGLWFTQTLESADGKYRLVTTLLHKSGQWLASETPLMIDGASNQAFGSGLTYMKRYALSAMLGVASEDDDDANEADGNTVQARQDHAPKTVDVSGRAKTAAPNGKAGKTTAADWTDSAMEKVNTFKTAKELIDWTDANQKTLESLADKEPNLSNRLSDLINDRLSSMGNLAAG